MKRLLALFGIKDPRADGFERTWRGLRTGDQRQLYTGLGLAAYSFLNRPRQKRLLFRKRLPEGSALVIHHRRKGDPKIEVVKPPPT